MGLLKRALRQLFERLTDVFDLAFGPRWNPVLHIGALGWFYYWIVAATGIYLFVFFDTGISAAYESVERITHVQWYAGGVMRSLHRYASDALVLMMMLHVAREFAYDRLRGRRWFAWITGVPLLWLVLASGISGYWLVWDRLAQYVAIATTEWLDALPLFGESIARNFLDSSALGERFFTLMVFIHIFVPLALLFAMWIHVQRHAQSRIHAPRGLAAGTLAMMVVLSLVRPALSQGPADLDTVPASIGLDWYYLAAYPLLDRLPGLTVWAIVGGATLLLALMPWLPPMRKPALAVVHLTDCNGCGRCNADCPFTAITMKARSDGLPYELEAVVEPDLCMSCGICAGACPTATPFRSASALVPGIELEDQPVAALREATARAGASLSGPARVIVFACGFGAEVEPLAGPSVACVRVPCVAALPPSFVDFVISRHHADGVMLAGCREGDCHYRLGQHWTEGRLAGTRDPHLRARVPRERLCVHWAGPGAVRSRRAALEAFRERLRGLGPWRRAAARVQEVPDA